MSLNLHNYHRRHVMRCTLATCAAMLARPATAVPAMSESITTATDVDFQNLADHLATVLRRRLPSDMVGELLTLPGPALENALVPNHDSVSSAALFQLINGSLAESLRAVELHCESDCLEGRMIVMKTWLACRTEVLVAHWYTQMQLPAENRDAWLNSTSG